MLPLNVGHLLQPRFWRRLNLALTLHRAGYTDVLTHGVRCVEIDAWDDDDNPNCPIKVTHGYTLTERLPFDQVCEAIVTADDSKIYIFALCSGS